MNQYKGKKVLEVGCGVGTDLSQFARNGAKVSGVDLTPKGIALAKKRFKVMKLKGDLKVGDAEKNLLKFQTRLETLQHKPKSSGKIRHERDKFFNKIKKHESNISLWENNIGFFNSDSEEAKIMLKDYHEKIDSAKKEITVLEEKIRMIDKSDSE